ncbi:AAA family ATPase [Inmirania thermothiophila]|uniref:Uncharacterized AAA domain-containing protein ycf46 n=1 Tax=Inmirania thermothiophila TaxID=1750597 RepID=A0A3N1Y1K6_9GAMM|nr:AAA family ATPase [Inmirania thermothiophila]ROR32690.1 SpoVK/Ycf46/Vps4 family AAA+-type ATPase [Inmirania thermothiophila]
MRAGEPPSDLRDLEVLIASRVPILAVETAEERRVEALFLRCVTPRGLPLFRWSVAEGLRRLDRPLPPQRHAAEPVEVLRHIRAARIAAVYLLLDFHPWLGEPLHVRLLREIAQDAPEAGHTVALVGPQVPIPPELRHHAVPFTPTLPGREELRALVAREAEAWARIHPGRRVRARPEVVERLVEHLAGLTLADARRLLRTAIHDDGALTDEDLPRVQALKHRLLDRGGLLGFETDTARFVEVAGLARLKRWLEVRRVAFASGQAPPGLDPPRGILLTGVQGCGKSLAAKAVAGAWRLPLLRLDFAVLYNKYYGETERNLREALRTAEAMAPCVLWIDEIEKGLATREDEGPGRRVLGTLLTWMAERTARVFVVATANEIRDLPPELLRKGRFDEIFFVDLPGPSVRREIFAIQLRRRGQDPDGVDLALLARESEGFSGAEIEQAVVSALYSAHAAGVALATEHLVAELQATRPLSVTMAERVASLRRWAAGRAVPAG